MVIFHGENTALSRQRLNQLIEKFRGEVVKLEGEKITLSELQQAVESRSIFGADKLVVIFGLFSRKPSKEKEKLLDYCQKENPQNLIVWEEKKIDGRVLINFKRAKIELFDLPKIIYKFLDSLSPFNKKTSLLLFHQCLKKEVPERIFYFLCRHIEQLIIAADLGKRGLKNLPDWKKEKLAKQAKAFGLEKLINIYQKLLAIDYQQKTGKSPFSLISSLDLLIAYL
jgi:DNA polymerase III delta subunit